MGRLSFGVGLAPPGGFPKMLYGSEVGEARGAGEALATAAGVEGAADIAGLGELAGSVGGGGGAAATSARAATRIKVPFFTSA